jgi:hypothetical protein
MHLPREHLLPKQMLWEGGVLPREFPLEPEANRIFILVFNSLATYAAKRWWRCEMKCVPHKPIGNSMKQARRLGSSEVRIAVLAGDA